MNQHLQLRQTNGKNKEESAQEKMGANDSIERERERSLLLKEENSRTLHEITPNQL